MINKFLFLFLCLYSINLYAEQILININSKVIEKTCSIQNNNIQVDMNLASIRDHSINTYFGKTPFSISIHDCPSTISHAYVSFNSNPDLINSKLIKNAVGTDYAAGVALALYYKNDLIDISSNKIDYVIDHSFKSHDIDFEVAYFRTEEKYTIGKVSAVVDFEISYE